MKFLILMLIAGTANASGFYVEGGLAGLLKQNATPVISYRTCVPYNTIDGVTQCREETLTYRSPRPYDLNDVQNPYGTLAIGYDWNWRAVVVDFTLFQHQSAISAGDHGENSVRLNVRWYPFHQ